MDRLRRWPAPAAAWLALSTLMLSAGCSLASSDAATAGPLQGGQGHTLVCSPVRGTPGRAELVGEEVVSNPTAHSLTISSVTLDSPRNISLVSAFLVHFDGLLIYGDGAAYPPRPAADLTGFDWSHRQQIDPGAATLPPAAVSPLGGWQLWLALRLTNPAASGSFTSSTVGYTGALHYRAVLYAGARLAPGHC